MATPTQRTPIQIVPHFSRLQEWIALDEGFFQDEGLEPMMLADVMHAVSSHHGDEYKRRPQDLPFVQQMEVVNSACQWGTACNAGAEMGKLVPDLYTVGRFAIFSRPGSKIQRLVDLRDVPGVTRDRREGQARLGDLEFTIIDTAGLDEGAKGSLTARMQEQTETAISLADALMFVIDARAGLTPNDRAFADFARRANKPVVLVANKSEGRQGDVGAMEAYALGLGDPIQISAEHGEGLSDLYDALRGLMPEPADDGDDDVCGMAGIDRAAVGAGPSAFGWAQLCAATMTRSTHAVPLSASQSSASQHRSDQRSWVSSSA